MANLSIQLVKAPTETYPAKNDIFQVKYGPLPLDDQLKEGEVLVENLYLSIDAAMRVWISGQKTYMDPVLPGDIMVCQAVSKVIASKSKKFLKGDFVIGLLNMTMYQIAKEKDLRLVKRGGDLDELAMLSLLGPLGISGLTAYVGLELIGKPKEGETIIVSAAAGAVGEIAIQLAKNYYKCRVIGIAGGQEKCDYVRKQLGAEDCIDYKNENISQRIKELCPKGVNIYFDNVGGEMLDTLLMHITDHSRIILCGAISTYNVQKEPYRIKNYPRLIIKRGVLQGYIYYDHPELMQAGSQVISKMIKEGQLNVRYDVQNGLDEAANGLQKLLLGKNNGKVVVRVFRNEKPKL